MIKKISILLSLILTITMADSIRPIIQLGFTSGGDELVTVEHDYSSNYTIDAGDGINMEVGMAIDNPLNNFETQLLIGYKFDSDSASNGDITWSTIPISALAFIKTQGWKFGGGFTYHINPSLEGDFSGGVRIRDDFDDALGAIIQIEYEPIDAFAIGVRGTFIEYQLTNQPSQKANGNSVGLVASFKFGGTQSRYR
jgi:hypothetical protein